MTCDNASNNDAMIEELQELIPEFAGSASHTCCFLHIINLIAKLLIRQFNAKKTSKGDHKLADLQKELEEEEATCQDRVPVDESDDEAKEEVDNDEGWVDEMENMTDEEKEELEKSIRPVELALVKVRLLDIYIPLKLTLGAALQGCLQDCPLDNQGSPGLERYPGRSSLRDQFDAERCCDLLELDLRLVGVCSEASQGGLFAHAVRSGPSEGRG